MLNPSTHLLIIEDDKGRREYTLEESVYSLGRDPQCDIRIHSMFISRHHATLVRQIRDDGSCVYKVVDGNVQGKQSANGLLVNSKKGLNKKAIARLTQRLQSIQLSPNVNGFLVFEFYISKRLVQQLTINEKASSVKDQTVIEAIRRSLLTWHSPQATVDNVCLVIGIQP